MKTKGAIWDEYTIVEFKDDGKTPKTVQCKHPGCDYRKAASQNRMLQHWRDKHTQPEEVEDALPVDTPLDTPEDVEVGAEVCDATQALWTPPPKKQCRIASYLDRTFTETEQENAEMAQAFAVVMNGHSYYSVERQWTIDFINALRKDYIPLTRYKLEQRIDQIEAGIKESVVVAITQHGYVAVAVDGWEDHQKRPTICFTVRVPTGRPYLFKFDRVDEAETGELLNNKIMEVVDELSDMGVVVTGVVADNAANIQKGLRLAARNGLLQANCFAHTLNLLLKDLAGLFDGQFQQMREVEQFFRNRHDPRVMYDNVLKEINGTRLIEPVDTRWGSQVEMLQSLLQNRRVIENAVLKLRANGFAFQGNELMFIWARDWWKTLEHLLAWLLPLRCALAKCERDANTLSEGVEHVIYMLPELLPTLRTFAPGDVAKASKMVEERHKMLLQPRALVANLLDHRYRGQNMTPELRGKAVRAVQGLARDLEVNAPSLDEVLAFVGETGAYQNSGSVSCHPFLFWATLHVDSCIAPLGKLLASIPASQASVERVFSTADWLATNRDRLGFRKLARDTFIRYNHSALSKR